MEQTIEINKVIMGGLGLGRAADGMAVMVAGVLPGVLRDGDLLLMMGAGDIGAAAQQIAREGVQGGQA